MYLLPLDVIGSGPTMSEATLYMGCSIQNVTSKVMAFNFCSDLLCPHAITFSSTVQYKNTS